MQARNPKYNQFGTIDLEIEHPAFGWIPFTADPMDDAGASVYAAAVAGDFGDVAAYVAPEPEPVTQDQIDAMRRAAYQQEADPLFFKAQRGEASMDDWLAKVAEIRQRHPDAA